MKRKSDQLKNYSKLASIIREGGLKVTAPRLLIAAALSKEKFPLSIKKIIKNLKQCRVDPVTVYRTVRAFKKTNIVSYVDFQDGRAYFELNDVKRDHHHIICVECRMVKDFIGCEYKKVAPKILKQVPDFAKVTGHSFEFFGICNSCVKK